MPENDNPFGKIIAKAWRDPAFKAALVANPAAALKAEGIEVPAGVTVTVVENTGQHFHLVLPPAPTDEIPDEELDGIAGGTGGVGAWTIFKSYLGATNIPDVHKISAQSKLISSKQYIKSIINK
jgi:hypothetical protein